MDLRRPVIDLFAGSRTRCFLISNQQPRRHDSTYRRTKKMLNVKPESSFLSSANSPRQDHIIFNPPSSTTSVLHTPLKFLPQDDKRRQLFASTRMTTTTPKTTLPPLLKPDGPGYQRHHLTEADAAEIKRLRSTNPVTWSRLRLAKKFNCSPLFVAICCEAPPEKKAAELAKVDAIKARWGPRARKAAADRAKRKVLWYQDA